jgi:hypothetical protein
MIEKAKSVIVSIFEKYNLSISILTAVIVLFLDYFTGEVIQFPIFYALPIGMIAWKRNKIIAYFLSITMPLGRFCLNFLWDGQFLILDVILNTVITSTALTLYAFLLNKISIQNEILKKSVYMLEGILPICSICKKIRNENGGYEKVDEFISNHSHAQFSHTLCPDCAKEFYPNYFKEKLKFKVKESCK